MWAAIKFPLADVRVVTFGAPRYAQCHVDQQYHVDQQGGHSLIPCIMIINQTPSSPHLFTPLYLPPRIGNLHYREAFMMLVGNSIRVVNRRDSLVKLPPSVRSSHYTHVDTCLWLNKHMTVLGHGRPSNVEATAFNNFEHCTGGGDLWVWVWVSVEQRDALLLGKWCTLFGSAQLHEHAIYTNPTFQQICMPTCMRWRCSSHALVVLMISTSHAPKRMPNPSIARSRHKYRHSGLHVLRKRRKREGSVG